MDTENQKVPYDIAGKEVTKWLDYKRIPENKREALQGMVDNLTTAVSEGTLSLDHENYEWNHTLVFPLQNGEGETTVNEIKYKARITDVDLSRFKRVVKGTDFDASLKKTILALTGQALGVINNLDSSTDRQIAESIAVFFV